MNKGYFTFVEVMVVLAILGILGTASFSIYTIWQHKNNVSSARSVVLQALTEAKQQAISGTNDKNWGIKYNGTQIVLFSGASYLTRDTNQDKKFDWPQGIYFGGLDEFIFLKFSGLPISTGTINIFYGNENEKININTQGIFSN